MCGIIGFLDKRGGQQNPIGKTLLGMLQALSCRGPDSAGVAIYGSGSPTDWHLRLSAPPGSDSEASVAALRELGVAVFRDYRNGVYDALLSRETDIATLEQRIQLQLPRTEVICFGKQLSLFKQVGSPEKLQATYAISEFTGSHGIGHTRLSTESRVDLSHSQPFWAHGVPDLATVHNGHITNYHKLRRQYEQRGYRFYTENDSEVIGVYLREQMEAGMSLEEALRSSRDDFDGSFCYLAATADCLALVKDRYGFKPLIVAETEDYVAIATEEIALHQALGRDFLAIAGEEIGLPDGFDSEFKAREPSPGTVGLWHIKQTAFAES